MGQGNALMLRIKTRVEGDIILDPKSLQAFIFLVRLWRLLLNLYRVIQVSSIETFPPIIFL